MRLPSQIYKLCLVFLLTSAVLVASASNLLRNGDLEGQDYSEFSAVHSRNVKFSVVQENGNHCAKLEVIRAQGGYYNGALIIGGVAGSDGQDGSKAFRVRPFTTYEFSFDVRGNIPLFSTKLWVWPEEGDGYYKGREQLDTTLNRIEVTEQWMRYTGEVTIYSMAHTAALRLVVYERAENYAPGSYVLVDNVVFREKPYDPAESAKKHSIKIDPIPLRVAVSMNSSGYYSPETGWETVNYLRLSSVSSTPKNIARFHIYWLFENTNNTFGNWNERSLRPYLHSGSGTINLEGAFIPGHKPIGLSLGRVFINYSPYTATIGYDYSKRAFGASFTNLTWKNINFSGFFVWTTETPRSFRFQGEGLRIRANYQSLRGEAILVRRLEGPPKYTYGLLPKFGEPKEYARQLSVNYRVNPNVNAEALWIDRYDYSDPQNTKKDNAHKIDLIMGKVSPKVNLSYCNFAENFEPFFRSTQPAFLYNDPDRYVGLNPIDLYKGQQGYKIDISKVVKNVNTELSLKRVRHVSANEPFTSYLTCALERNKHSLELLLKRNQTGACKYKEYAWKRTLLDDQSKTIKTNLAYIHDLTRLNNDLLTDKQIREFSVECIFRRGLIPGLNLKAGLQKTDQSYLFFRTKFSLLNNLQVRIYWRNKNVVENLTQMSGVPFIYDTFWSDEFGRLHFTDNHVAIQSKISF